MCVCVCACVRVCVCACVRACVRACVGMEMGIRRVLVRAGCGRRGQLDLYKFDFIYASRQTL